MTDEKTLTLYKKQVLKCFALFHKVCFENNIRYSLYHGTLLGCIRHKGFIPWDDDFDVVVPREDVQKLKAAFNNGKYFVACPGDKDYYYPFFKIFIKDYPIIEKRRKGKSFFWIDVFVADKVDLSNHSFIREHKKIMRRILLLGQDRPNYTVKYPKYILFHRIYDTIEWLFCNLFFSLKKELKKYEKLLEKYRNDSNNYAQVIWSNNLTPDANKLDFDYLTILKFEGVDAFVFTNYDAVLRILYGDYMKLPRPSERIPHHNYELVH